jgi:16S rRNA (guanine966-N2)-methyltransferase
MRIIAGEWRGRPIVAPAGQETRPTSDRAREGLFSMLTSRLGTFEGLRVADLFAGSGALGLEALSRGAAHCLFVDSDPKAVAAIRRNLQTLGAGDRGDICAQRAEHAAAPAMPCHLALLDPPYAGALAKAALKKLREPGWLAGEAVISVETASPELDLPPGLERETVRRFGRAHIHLLRRSV